MGNPENAATSETANSSTDVTKQVGSIVKQVTTDEEGNYIFPENVELSEEMKFAVTAEKRRRDTLSSYTQGQQSLKELQAANEALLKIVNGNIKLTKEQQNELDDLKYKDPDAWRVKLNEFESTAKTEQENRIKSLTDEAKQNAGGEFELSRRAKVLEEFNELHGVKITDELIQNEIPPRITKKLADGKVTFEQYLDEVLDYATTAKVIDSPATLDQPNLSKANGSNFPSQHKAEESLSKQYSKDLY